MCDKMDTMIITKKDNIMETIFEMVQIDVKGSSMIRAFEKQKKEAQWKKKRKR